MNLIFALIVALMAAAALACVLWPLLRTRSAARAPTSLTAALSIGLPIAALAIYFAVGTPAALNPANRVAAHATPADVSTAINQLAAHLAKQPDDLEGWVLLGRAYQAMQKPAEAAQAFNAALKLAPEDANLLAATAEARSLASADHRIDGDTLALLDKAIKIDPANQRALWLRGIADYQAGNYDGAETRWQRLLSLLDPDSEVAQSVRVEIANAAKAKANPVPAPTGSTAAAASAATGIAIHVALDPALAAKAPRDGVVFVYANAVDGPTMPLAVARLKVSDLPADVRLDDAMAMTPQAKLSMFRRVTIGARVSASGDATPVAGDLESKALAVDMDAAKKPATVVIDHVRGATKTSG